MFQFGDHELYKEIGEYQEKLNSDKTSKHEKEKLDKFLNLSLRQVEYYEQQLKDVELSEEDIRNYEIKKMFLPYYSEESVLSDHAKIIVVINNFNWFRLSPLLSQIIHVDIEHRSIIRETFIKNEYQFKLKT